MLITSNGPTCSDRRRSDPLLDLDGLWTPALGERYLPIPGVPPARSECVDGRLVMTPRLDPAQSSPLSRPQAHYVAMPVGLLGRR